MSYIQNPGKIPCNLYKQGENIANMLCNIYLYF